jgi:proton-coupled amino acid transporter
VLWPDAIGFSVYAFEGIGVILPIMEVTEHKQDFVKILSAVLCFVCLLYIAFSEVCLFAYGGFTLVNPDGLHQPLIIDSLPP